MQTMTEKSPPLAPGWEQHASSARFVASLVRVVPPRSEEGHF